MDERGDLDEEHGQELGPRGQGLGALRRRGIYLLPNLFTTGVLFCGFYAIVQAMTGHFEIACVAVYVAMVLDGADGRVARWTNTQSEFRRAVRQHRRHGGLSARRRRWWPTPGC
jgi:hypothetical protein